MSIVFTIIFIISIAFSIITGNANIITSSITQNSSKAIQNIISLTSMMCFWSGIFKIFESTTIVEKFSKKLSIFISKIFEKDSLSESAKKYISLNIVSNMLGIGNAATVNGIKAMEELSKYSKKGIASNNMTRFVLINTASIQLFPTTMISLRNMYGSVDSAKIVFPIIIISFTALFVSMQVMKLLNVIIKEE